MVSRFLITEYKKDFSGDVIEPREIAYQYSVTCDTMDDVDRFFESFDDDTALVESI